MMRRPDHQPAAGVDEEILRGGEPCLLETLRVGGVRRKEEIEGGALLQLRDQLAGGSISDDHVAFRMSLLESRFQPREDHRQVGSGGDADRECPGWRSVSRRLGTTAEDNQQADQQAAKGGDDEKVPSWANEGTAGEPIS